MSATVAATTLTPTERYRQCVANGEISADSAQQAVLEELEALFHALQRPTVTPGLLRRLLPGKPEREPLRGLYLWGEVGRGKTFLVDIFYDCLPLRDKRRVHFHRFMREVHTALRAHRRQQDPLPQIAREIARDTRLLVLDEFFVADIADAMLLGGLLEGLFDQGVTLVTTSNAPPHELYRDGLQRARFEPAIALLEQHTRVMSLDGDTDYRLRALEQAEIYHTPLDAGADTALDTAFTEIAPDAGKRDTSIEIEGRKIPVRRLADGVVWLDFDALCDGPRSQNDYLELACQFQTLVVSDVPVMDWRRENQARRFINLIDVLYEHNVKLILSAEAPPDSLYQGERLRFEFQRTTSRLLEMQSHDYLARAHRP